MRHTLAMALIKVEYLLEEGTRRSRKQAIGCVDMILRVNENARLTDEERELLNTLKEKRDALEASLKKHWWNRK